MIPFFEDKKAHLKARLNNDEHFECFRDLPEVLLTFICAEKMSLFLTPGTRLVKDEHGAFITGYSQHYFCPDDRYHSRELTPFHLKGYWIPESEGKLFAVDRERSCPLIRQGSEEKEILFLIHPKSESLFVPLMQKYKHQEVLVSALSLSSFRTLLISIPVIHTAQKYTYTMVKVTLDEDICGVSRILSLKECACSVGMTATLENKPAPISCFSDDFSFVPNACLLDPKVVNGAGMIHRSIPHFLNGSANHEYVISFFALFGNKNSPLLDSLITLSRKSPTDFVKDFLLSPLSEIFVDFIYNNQTSIEAHAQNLMLSINIQDPDHLEIRFLYRDMGGVNCLLLEKDFALLPSNLRNADYYYIENHFKDTARAFEYFATTVLFNLTKQFFKSEKYEDLDPTFALWKSAMIQKGFSGNWTHSGGDVDAHDLHFTPENFCRYGYFEKIFGEILLKTLLHQGIFKKLVGDQEVEAYHYFAERLFDQDNPYDTCIQIEWFHDLILNTYPEYVSITAGGMGAPTLQTMQESIKSLLVDNEALLRPFYTPSEDLFKIPIERLMAFLSSRYMIRLIESNPFLFAMHEQVQNNLKHLNLEFEVVDSEYMHDPVFSGPYPFKPTLNALKSVHHFLLAVAAIEVPEILVDENSEEIEVKIHLLREEHTYFIKKVIANPFDYYNMFKHRVESQGVNAKFEEFVTVIELLRLSLSKESIVDAVRQNPAFAIMHQMALRELKNIKEAGCPYRDFLDTLEYCLGFLDVFERGKSKNDEMPKLFHSYRYCYYSSYLKDQIPEHIVLPSFYNLGATDLLKIRGVPIGFLGVNIEPVWVDGCLQTPLEFWYHDVNHTRRMWQFFKRQATLQSMSLQAFIEKSHFYVTNQLIPLISIEAEDSHEIANQKRMIKIIFFEILHEDAFAADPTVIATMLTSPPGSLTAVESIDGNKVKYMMEKSAGKLALVHWKLVANFYDTIEERRSAIVSPECRSTEHVFKAAMLIAEKLQLSGVVSSTIRDCLYCS